jgi:hypothetical protein
MLAWQGAHEEVHVQIEAGQAPAAMAECVRYALIRTSINSLSANYVPALVAQAVKTGLWPAERALSVARQVPDPQERLSMLAALLDTGLYPEQSIQTQEAGLAAALASEHDEDLAEALVALAPQLTGEALDGALQAARAIEHEWARARALVAFLPVAPDPAAVLRRARQAIADHLLKNLSGAERGEVLKFCADQKLLAPPLLDQDTRSNIAGHIVEVCEVWRWM